jgi:hypothetical protein
MQAMAAHGPLEDAAVGAARAAMALREWSAALVHLSRAMELRLAREPAAHCDDLKAASPLSACLTS